jgi:hypothetical protein
MTNFALSLLNHSANFSSRTSQDVLDGLSDESDGESLIKRREPQDVGERKPLLKHRIAKEKKTKSSPNKRSLKRLRKLT